MGWCSGTSIFDSVAAEVIDNPKIPVEQQVILITALYRAMRDEDWDCEGDSEYYEHPVFLTAEFVTYGSVTRYNFDTGEDVDVSDKVLMQHLPDEEDTEDPDEGEEWE